MKKILFILLAISSAAYAGSVEIKVKGLVCAFCAQALINRANRNPKIAKADVSLEKGELKLSLKPDTALSDDEINDLVDKAGFKISSISRQPSP